MNNKNKNIIIIILIVIIVVLIGYIVYGKTTSNENNLSGEVGQNTNTKINLENIKYDYNDKIIGKYANKNDAEDYFVLYSDGKADLNYPSGDNGSYIKKEKINYTITYNESIVIINFSGLSEIEGPIKVGLLTENRYVFANTTTNPSTGALMFVYERD